MELVQLISAKFSKSGCDNNTTRILWVTRSNSHHSNFLIWLEPSSFYFTITYFCLSVERTYYVPLKWKIKMQVFYMKYLTSCNINFNKSKLKELIRGFLPVSFSFHFRYYLHMNKLNEYLYVFIVLTLAANKT